MKAVINNNNANFVRLINENKCSLLIILCLYKLFDKALDKGYNFSLDFKNHNFSFSK